MTTSTPWARSSRHRLDDLVVRLAEAGDEPGLRQHGVVGDHLRAAQQVERAVVARLRSAHAPMQPADGLDVVAEDLRSRAEHGRERPLLVAEEVGRQELDRAVRQLRLQRPGHGREVAGTSVVDVVAIDRGDDDVLEAHLRSSLREAQRLERIGRVLGLAGVDVAVAAGARARVAEDLERRGALAPALGDVRAARLLADGVQARAVDQLLDVEVAAVGARRAHLHPLGAARAVGDGKRGLHGSQCTGARAGRFRGRA